MRVECPNCSWPPKPDSLWNCENCGHPDHLVSNAGECPQCGFTHNNIYCIEWEGGCGETSPILDWFPDMDEGLGELNIERLLD